MNARSWTTTLVIAMVATLLMPALSAQADWYHHKAIVEIKESISLEDASKLDILFRYGKLRIEHGPNGVIEVEGTVAIKRHKRERLERALAKLELKVEAGDTISLSLPMSDNGKDYKIDLTVRVPRDLDLAVEMNVGKLNLDIEAPSRARVDLNIGELTVVMPRNTAAQIDARVNIGDLDVRGFDHKSRAWNEKRLLGAKFEGTLGDVDMAKAHQFNAKVNIGEVSIVGRN